MLEVKTLISEAMNLKAPQKMAVIEALVNSLDTPNSKIQEIWSEEAYKRLTAYREGKLETIPLEELFTS